MNTRRSALSIVLPAAILAAAVIPIALYGDELPDRVASHFDISGTPDSSMTPLVFFLVAAVSLILPGVGMVLGGVLVALAAVLWVATEWWVGLILLVSALPVGLLSSFRVQVDRSGLSVRSALFRVRFAHVDIDEMERASVFCVEPMQWGGWGYRGSLKMAGSAAVVVRRGPGIHLQLSGNRSFVVTLEDPRTPAAILNAHLD